MIYIIEIENAIKTLGIENAEVCIHSSMKSLGDEIEGGIKGVLNAFLNRNCTVMVPTFSYEYAQNPVDQYMPKRNGFDYHADLNPHCNPDMIFYPDSKNISTGHMGMLPKAVLDDPASRRGNHPLNSFSAIGRNAERLICSQTPQNVYGPLKQLVEDDGYILLLGVELDRATIIHYAEQLAGRNLFIRWAKDQKRNIIPVSVGSCSSGFLNFSSVLTGQKEILVGKSLWQCYKAIDLVETCRKAICENPQITHCRDSNCRRCEDAILGGPITD